VKLALVPFAAMLTDDGTCAIVLLLLSARVAPAEGAGPFRVTVPVDVPPPITVLGLRIKDARVPGLMVRVAERVVLYVADTVTDVALATAVVVTVKVLVVVPAATVILAGSAAAELLSDRVTVIPPEGAAPFRDTVPVEELPPTTLLGLRLKLLTEGGLIVKPAVLVTLYRADTVTEVALATGVVVTVKFAVVAPDGTVTFTGTCAALLLSDSAMTMPVAGAGPFSRTVPVDELPPTTDVGAKLTPVREGGLTVKAAVFVPLYVADIVTKVLLATAVVVTVNAAVVAPAPTAMLAGTFAEPLLEDSATAAPPAGAGPFRVTVPVELLPPTKLIGLRLKELAEGGLIVSPAVCVTL
jgi:hypothetical protein